MSMKGKKQKINTTKQKQKKLKAIDANVILTQVYGRLPTKLHQGQFCLKFCCDQQKHICLL